MVADVLCDEAIMATLLKTFLNLVEFCYPVWSFYAEGHLSFLDSELAVVGCVGGSDFRKN